MNDSPYDTLGMFGEFELDAEGKTMQAYPCDAIVVWMHPALAKVILQALRLRYQMSVAVLNKLAWMKHPVESVVIKAQDVTLWNLPGGTVKVEPPNIP